MHPAGYFTAGVPYIRQLIHCQSTVHPGRYFTVRVPYIPAAR
jgi:hypothetical protein